jgi:hypothetical protein
LIRLFYLQYDSIEFLSSLLSYEFDHDISTSSLIQRALQFKVTRKRLVALEQRFGIELIHHQLFNHAYQLGKGSDFLNATDVIASADIGYGTDRSNNSVNILAMRKQILSIER